MIIGLTGLKGAGKDTVAAYLVKEYQFERKAFADPLKRSVAALFGIPFHQIDKLKNDDKAVVQIKADWFDSSDRNPEPAPVPGFETSMSFRGFLQKYGTEAGREVYGEDFWADLTLPIDGYYPGRKIVITDCRFENEADRIWLLGGKIVRVYRDDVVVDDQHPSENPIFLEDYAISNNGTLDDLWSQTEVMLHWASELDTAS